MPDPPDDVRACEYCGDQLPLEDFAGDATCCKRCAAVQSQRWEDANPDKIIRHG